MEKVELEAKKRERTGTIRSRESRSSGFIPAIVYGKGTQWCTSASVYTTLNIWHGELPANALQQVCYALSQQQTSPESKVVDHGLWKQGDEAYFLKLIVQLNGLDIDPTQPADQERAWNGLTNRWKLNYGNNCWTGLFGQYTAVGEAIKKRKGEPVKIPNAYLNTAIATANDYLNSGSLYMIYKNGKPWIQMADGKHGVEIKNEKDEELLTCGTTTAVILHAILTIEFSERLKMALRKLIDADLVPSPNKEDSWYTQPVIDGD